MLGTNLPRHTHTCREDLTYTTYMYADKKYGAYNIVIGLQIPYINNVFVQTK